jgi:CspA family cold shock protein
VEDDEVGDSSRLGIAQGALSGGAIPMSERVEGNIKWFSHQKRYGFIQRKDGGTEVFVHANDFREGSQTYWLSDGDKVGFEVVQADKGPRAIDVVVLESA